MNAVNILVDVHGTRSSRLILTNDQNTLYRLYINDDLLTERSWIWKNTSYIKENIWVFPAATNILTIEPVLQNTDQSIFKLNNFTVVDQPFISEQINGHTISFTLQ
jgi:hypothetical protein